MFPKPVQVLVQYADNDVAVLIVFIFPADIKSAMNTPATSCPLHKIHQRFNVKHPRIPAGELRGGRIWLGKRPEYYWRVFSHHQ